jgi:hypothetical protein
MAIHQINSNQISNIVGINDMGLRTFRVNPSYILGITIIVTLAAAIFEGQIQNRRANVIEARASYIAALDQARIQLAELVSNVATDKSLKYNIDSKLQHSIKSTLDAQLQTGALDQLTLMTATCEPVVKSSKAKYVPYICPEDKKVTTRFFWVTHEGTPSLALIRSLADVNGLPMYLLGMVHISENWISNSPELAVTLKNLAIEIGGNGTVIYNDSKLDQGTFSAPLVSTHSLDKHFLKSAEKNIIYNSPFLIPLLCLALLCCLFVIARELVYLQRLKKVGSDLIDWAKSVSPIGGFTAPGKAPIVATGVPAKDLATTKELVTRAFSLKNEQMHKISQKFDNAQLHVKVLNDEILGLQKRLSELAELDSLAIQLGNTTESFLDHVQSMNLNAEDISDIVGTEIAERGSLLHNMLMEWQEGVAERGSRKFIRGLSETPGRTKESNLLDEQIVTIATVAGEISDLAIQASILAHKIAEVSSYSARIAGLWRGIALKTNADKICYSLIPVIEAAQEVIGQNKKYRNVQFQNLLNPAETSNIPEIPISLWQSALFQIYASVAELSSGKPARVVTKIRNDGTKAMLVVQVVATESHVLPQRTQRQSYLLEVAKSVLTPFAVNVTALPALEGPFPIALTWQNGEKPLTALPEPSPTLLLPLV